MYTDEEIGSEESTSEDNENPFSYFTLHEILILKKCEGEPPLIIRAHGYTAFQGEVEENQQEFIYMKAEQEIPEQNEISEGKILQRCRFKFYISLPEALWLDPRGCCRTYGNKAPAVARLEASSGHSPSVSTLRKYAQAVGCDLVIHFKPFSKKSIREKHT